MAAISLWVIWTGAALALLVFGLRLLLGAIRFALWLISTKAGWVTAGVLFLGGLVVWNGWW